VVFFVREGNVITGFNTDVEYSGRIYHIQTEDKGVENPVLESMIYLGGEILASHRASYEDLLDSGPDPKAVAERLEAQHQRMVLNVRQGRYDPEGVKTFGAGTHSERGLEELVLDYLAHDLGPENLQVSLESPAGFEEGKPLDLSVRVRGELSSLPVHGAKVSLRLITPVEKPRTLLEGKTDARGLFQGVVTLPPSEGGSAALLLQATLGQESVELKWLVDHGSEGA
jgi:hypothetical protein